MRAETQSVFVGARRYLASLSSKDSVGVRLVGIVFPFEVLWCGDIFEKLLQEVGDTSVDALYAMRQLPATDKLIKDPPPTKRRRPKPPPVPDVSHALVVGTLRRFQEMLFRFERLCSAEGGHRLNAFTILRNIADVTFRPLTAEVHGIYVADGGAGPVCRSLMPRPLVCSRNSRVRVVIGPHLCVQQPVQFLVPGEHVRPRLRQRVYELNFSHQAEAMRAAFSDKPRTVQFWDDLRTTRRQGTQDWVRDGRERVEKEGLQLERDLDCGPYERNAVLTITSGYSMKKIEHLVGTFLRFVKRSGNSASRSKPNCTTVFVIFSMNLSVYADVVRDHPSRLIIVDTQLYLPTMASKHCGPAEHRCEVMYRWLRDDPVAHTFGHFFMIDSRDVYFQRDPFEALFAMPEYRAVMKAGAEDAEFVGDVPEELLLGSEDTVYPWLTHHVAGWISITFNKNVYRLLEPLTIGPLKEGMPLVNSGLMFGTRRAVRDFLYTVSETVNTVQPWCIADQVVLWALVGGAFALAGFPYRFVLMNPESTPFRNCPRGSFSIRFAGEDNRFLVNSRNESYAIVHQLDRFQNAWSQSHAGTEKV
jgi:hypothetical protein